MSYVSFFRACHFSPSGACLQVLEVLWFCNNQGAFFFSQKSPNIQDLHQCSVSDVTGTSLSDSPLKIQGVGHIFHFFPLSSIYTETMNWTFPPSCAELCSLGEGATWVRNDGFSNSFQHGFEHTSGATTSQLVSWVFIKAFGLYVIVKSVSLWESKVWDFLVCHLALQTNF